jgi:hypothetical protein
MEIIGKVISSMGKNLYKVSFEGANEKERNMILDYVLHVYRE